MSVLHDAILGAAVGDALGVPFEFKRRDEFACFGMKGFGSHRQPAGTWSDDTSLILATCDSLRLNEGRIDLDDLKQRFSSWLTEDAYTIDKLFDCGITTKHAILSGEGARGEYDNGNGSLMRIVPLAFVEATDADVEAVSALTHAHAISCQACVNFVRIARLLEEHRDVDALCESLVDLPYLEKPFHRLTTIADLEREDISSGGYVVHTLEAALWCLLTTNSYEECVRTAVNLGEDTDTTACVAGALAGIAYGSDAIPTEWLETLRGRDLIEGCLFA